MTSHPIEAVVVNLTTVNKAPFREEIKQYVREFGTVAAFRLYDLPNVPNALIAGNFYYYDSADVTTVDNGTTCILDVSNRRFKLKTTSVAGKTLFTASGVAGTNSITANTDGMAAPSATPQLVLLIPVNTCSGAVAIVFDAFGSLSVVSPLGAALATGEFVAGVPYLLSVTSTNIKILFSGATW